MTRSKYEPESEFLCEWLKGNPKAPREWQRVAKQLRNYKKAHLVWRVIGSWKLRKELSKDATLASAVFSDVCNALDRANKEAKRASMSVTKEREALAKIRSLASDLRSAIYNAKFLAGSFVSVSLRQDGHPDLDAIVGWHKTPNNTFGFGYGIDISEILTIAMKMADNENKKPQQVRSVLRRKSNAMRLSFIRWLEYQLKCRFHVTDMNGIVAHLTSAIFNERISKRQVTESLSGQPSQFDSMPRDLR